LLYVEPYCSIHQKILQNLQIDFLQDEQRGQQYPIWRALHRSCHPLHSFNYLAPGFDPRVPEGCTVYLISDAPVALTDGAS